MQCERFGSAAGLRVSWRWRATAHIPSAFLLVHACRRCFRWRLCCARLWNDCFLHGCGWHFGLIVRVRVFSLNRFAVERVDQFAFSCLPYGGDSHEEHRCFVQMPVTTEAILRLLICTFIPPTNDCVQPQQRLTQLVPIRAYASTFMIFGQAGQVALAIFGQSFGYEQY